jgi:hypothetical protein
MGHNRGPALDANDGDPELVFDDRHMQLLRDDKMRNFRIDIETDSTTRADENAEKAAANEFLQTMRQAVEGLAKLPPPWALWSIRSHRR